MKTEDLLKLADVLEVMPEENFNLKTWKCGTVACAVGVAGSMPEFIAKGFLLTDPEGEGDVAPVFIANGGEFFAGWEAVEEFFEITLDQAHELFAASAYSTGSDTTARAVSVRIRKFATKFKEANRGN